MIVIAQSLRRSGTDILYVGESSLDVGEQTVRETTRSRNDRLPHCLPLMHFAWVHSQVCFDSPYTAIQVNKDGGQLQNGSRLSPVLLGTLLFVILLYLFSACDL